MIQFLITFLLFSSSNGPIAGNSVSLACDGPQPVDPGPHVDYSPSPVSTGSAMTMSVWLAGCSSFAKADMVLHVRVDSSGGAAAKVDVPSSSEWTATTMGNAALSPGASVSEMLLHPVGAGNQTVSAGTLVGLSLIAHAGNATGAFQIHSDLQAPGLTTVGLDSESVTVQ